jgi:4-hydroxyphenylpyruvate dioxygenase
MDRTAQVYRHVFGLDEVQSETVEAAGSDDLPTSADGMRSVVLRAPRGLTVVLTEPLSSSSEGQTQQFLEAHTGPGMQHFAIAFDDLVSAVRPLRANGVPFLPVPRTHLDRSQRRLHGHDLPWGALRDYGILVDSDAKGLLFQLFTRPITARGSFFIELIQRAGATGFGGNNVRALFAAVDAAARAPAGVACQSSQPRS